jgi:hypothetical protein
MRDEKAANINILYVYLPNWLNIIFFLLFWCLSLKRRSVLTKSPKSPVSQAFCPGCPSLPCYSPCHQTTASTFSLSRWHNEKAITESFFCISFWNIWNIELEKCFDVFRNTHKIIYAKYKNSTTLTFIFVSSISDSKDNKLVQKSNQGENRSSFTNSWQRNVAVNNESVTSVTPYVTSVTDYKTTIK